MDFSLSSSLVGNAVSNPDKLALDLQFATDKTLTARKGPTPVFTRGSTGRFVGSNGLIQSAAINAPRFDHDPVTGVCKGLLIEEARTNLVTQSENIGVWSGVFTNNGSTTAPDGTSSGLLVGVGTGNCQTLITVNTTGLHTSSVYLKRNNTDWVRIQGVQGANVNTVNAWINLSNGTVGTVAIASGAPTLLSAQIAPAGNNWYRVSVIASYPATNYLNLNIISAPADNNTTRVAGSIYGVWGGQIEAGSFPTSYIPTTTSSVVRSADVCSITGSAFSGFYNQPEGTLFADVTPQTVDQVSVVVGVNTSASTRSHFIYKINSAINAAGKRWGAQTVSDAGAQTAIPTSTDVAISRARLAYGYKLNDFAFTYAGVIVGTDTIGTIPVPTAMRIGSRDDGLYINGHIASVRYYKKRLLNAKLQAITV